MTAGNLTRRDFSALAGTLAGVFGAVGTAVGATPKAPSGEEITHSGAAIRQEVDFPASATRVYQALTVTEQFDKIVQLSAAMNSGMKKMLGASPTTIDAQPGGAFSLFGGYVTGRFLELVRDTRIVQAWRAGSWDAGQYSIATYVLEPQGGGTKLVFEHKGFPDEAAAHLAEGWHINYWNPLTKFLI